MSDDRRSDPPDYGATVRNIRLPEGTGRQPTQYTEPPPTPRPPQPPPKKRGIPIWVWLGAAGALFVMFVAVVLVVYFFLLREPGFTMIVRGAPAGSDVYVDNISRGVTSADGSIRVPGLKAGKKMVRVSHAGYNDFNTSVAGKDGEVRTVIAQLTPIESKPAGLANEIDYNGPMLLIGAGEFVMGSDKHKPDEKPAHKVTLPDFYIDKFEVT
ncbi:MAG TPA: SUMF1/EgtB/PvdO family nonheme iron enzyme, partial [Pyrinomonadaceae bacterium]|nr:SUMF1/EgtB/PvdO family nonheme iron enzyme [Pyrinomonadaceae bacterium]